MTAPTLEKNGEKKESSKVSKRNRIHPGPIPFFVSLVNAWPKNPQTQIFNSNLKILWLRQVTIERLVEPLWNQCHTLYRPGTLLLMFLCLTIMGKSNFIICFPFCANIVHVRHITQCWCNEASFHSNKKMYELWIISIIFLLDSILSMHQDMNKF